MIYAPLYSNVGGNGLLVYVDNVDTYDERAKAAGTLILSAPENSFPGRRYRCEDLEGQR